MHVPYRTYGRVQDIKAWLAREQGLCAGGEPVRGESKSRGASSWMLGFSGGLERAFLFFFRWAWPFVCCVWVCVSAMRCGAVRGEKVLKPEGAGTGESWMIREGERGEGRWRR